MGRMCIATPWLVDKSTTVLSTGNELASLPVSQLRNMQPSSVWRTNGLANVYVVVNFASAQEIDFVALVNTNATYGAQWRIRGATSEGNLTAAPGYDSGLVDISVWRPGGAVLTEQEEGWRGVPAVKRLASPQTYAWWRIDVVDTNNPAGYFQAGRLFLTKAWTPSINMQFGWAMAWQDASIQVAALDGNIWTGERQRRRVAAFNLAFLAKAEMYSNAYEIDRRAGMAKDVLWCADPDDATDVLKNTVHGILGELAPIVNPAYQIFERNYKIVELI